MVCGCLWVFSNMASSRELDCRIQRFSLIREQIPIVMAGTFLAALALFFFLEKGLSTQVRGFWLALVVLINFLRALCLRYWFTHETTRDNINQRIIIACVLAFLMSSAFGLHAYMGISESDVLTTLLILMILTGMVAAAAGTSAYIRPMFLLVVVPLMLPVTIKMFGFEQEICQWVSGMILVFLIICTGAAQIVNASVAQSIDMRFENQDLLEDLQLEKQRVEKALIREAQANQAKSKFIAAASHDLRQPMHSLRLFTATLELQTRDTRHKTLVSQIDTSVKSLEGLFNALLDISKLDAGTELVNKQHVQLHSLLLQLQSDFQPLAVGKGIEFVCDVEDCIVYTDLVLLQRLIRNLVSNAIRYTSTGTVTLAAKQLGESVLISVTDTGPGISTKDQIRVFDEFVQLNSDQHASGEGIGLGLAIVKRISILLDIPISLVSEPGLGAVFSVKITCGQFDKAEDKAEDKDGEVNYLDDVENLFVLVIDDEPAVCLAVEVLLEVWGYVVMTAISGDAAVTQLREIDEIPDVIISDYRLSNNETGGSAIEKVRNYLEQEIPAIIITGDIAPGQLSDMKKLGLPMLYKPCEPDELRKLLVQQAGVSGNTAAYHQLSPCKAT
ncbi:MAG: signal transduction histidine kinase/CheY-like chemotaxis protein [Gammaproteobacteria bacterium]|jgi:signal transduction histidine kinase/CheY-like chemotaxis protein